MPEQFGLKHLITTYGSQTPAPPGTGCWSGGHPAADIPSPQRPTCAGVSCTYSSETETSPNRIRKPPCLKRGENRRGYGFLTWRCMNEALWCSSSKCNSDRNVFHNAYFYVECIHHVAHSQLLAPAVVTMNLLLVHNNFDLFIPPELARSNQRQTESRGSAGK